MVQVKKIGPKQIQPNKAASKVVWDEEFALVCLRVATMSIFGPSLIIGLDWLPSAPKGLDTRLDS